MSPRRLRLHTLEARIAPAIIVWDGGPTGNGTAWADPVNWQGDVAPGSSDQAHLSATGSQPTIVISTPVSLQAVVANRGLTVATGGKLSVGGSSSIFEVVTLAGGQVDFADGAFVNTAQFFGDTVVIAASRTVTWFECTSAAPVTIAGTLNVRGSLTLNGPANVELSAGLKVIAANDATTLTVNAGLINRGTLEMTSTDAATAVIDVKSGGFLNGVEGTVISSTGGGGARDIRLGANQVWDNQGKLQITGASLSVSKSSTGHAIVNSGSIQVASGLALNADTTFSFAGGKFAGGGKLSVTTAKLNGDYTVSGVAEFHLLNMAGSGTLTIPPGVLASTSLGGNLSLAVINQGTFTVNGSATIAASFTTSAGSILRVQANGAVPTTLTISAAFVNAAQLELTSNNSVFSGLNIKGAAFVNAPAGTIVALAGAGGSRSIGLSNGGSFTQQGTLRTNGANLTLSGDKFSNDGSIVVGANTTLTATSDFVNQSTGAINGVGTLQAPTLTGAGRLAPGNPPGTLTLAANSTLSGPLAIELNGVTQYDQLKAVGKVALAGPLELTLGYLPTVGSSFVIIDNDGIDAVTGTFTGLKQGDSLKVGAVTLAVSYTGGTGNDVVLTVTDNGTINPTKVTGILVNDGAVQRSRVTNMKLTFNQPATWPGNPADAFQLKRQSDNAVVNLGVATGSNAATITFTGGAVDVDSLADGRYTLMILAAQISSLDGNGDGTPGDDYTFNLHRLFGDNDGDADVDTSDFGAFARSFGGVGNVFDFDNDGDVDTSDFAAFRGRFGATI